MNDRGSVLKAQLELRKSVAQTLKEVGSGQRPTMPLSEVAGKLLSEHSPVLPGDDRWALAEALRALGMAAAWEPAVETADGGAVAKRDASRLIAEKTLSSERRGTWNGAVVEALKILANLDAFADVPRAAIALKRAPIVFATTDILAPPRPVPQHQTPPDTDVTPTVLLHFTLNDEPISWPMALQVGMSYKFGGSAIVDDWPFKGTEIHIEWKTEAPKSIIDRTGFRIMADGKTSDGGYLHARAEIPPDQGVDLIPVVTIRGLKDNRFAARVVGHSSLRVNTFQPFEIGAGLPMVAQRVLELLAELDARIPSLPQGDRLNLLHLLDATTRFAAGAIYQKDLCDIDESAFQKKLKQAFFLDHRIGGRIQEGSKLGGGETDLVLDRIVNELKVSRTPVDFKIARKFIGQATQYSSAGDCPVSILTILDQSKKSKPPGILSNFMQWAEPQVLTGGSVHTPSMVAIIIIPVGFPVPSEWSKSSRHPDKVVDDRTAKA